VSSWRIEGVSQQWRQPSHLRHTGVRGGGRGCEGGVRGSEGGGGGGEGLNKLAPAKPPTTHRCGGVEEGVGRGWERGVRGERGL
jgi:hypothetical protein